MSLGHQNNTNANSRRVAQLRRILAISRQMAATPDLDALLVMIVDATCEVLECDRASIFLFDPETNELFSRVATGVSEIRFPATAGIAGSATQTGQIINVPDAYADTRFNPDVDKKTGFHTRNLLTIPLKNIDGELTGVLQAVNKRDGAFSEADEELAETLGAQTGVTLHRARLLEAYAEKERMTRELDIARSIQQSQLPKSNPDVAGYDIAGWNRSADETGGDSYNFIPLEDGRLAIMLADATGHGIGAALVIAQFHAQLRAQLSLTTDLGEIATRINKLLCLDLSESRFVTAFMGILDPEKHVIDYVSAGQAPLLIVTPQQVCSRNATGLPLAIMPEENYEPTRVEFAPNTLFALLTDGFYETTSPDNAVFGISGVTNTLQRLLDKPGTETIETLHDEVKRFSHNAPQADDLTAVLIRRLRE